ncbi:hypothetical protein [Halosolutus halophilus]|uniref:hypothetical protein n=1 Tax=Halosolutus halophilus TaxID=1552990 RepID=UPI002235275B|nr:hypothetical protein [Halosolutus halophilus]
MPAFRPNSTDSSVRLATWLVFRIVAAVVGTTFVGFALTSALFLDPFVALAVAFVVALWLSLLLLFEALDVFLDAKLAGETGGEAPVE